MKKFLVVYHAPMDAEAMQRMAEMTPEQQAKGMDAWMQWAQKCGDSLVEMGAPLMNGRQLSHDGSVANSDRHVSGYSILQAESMHDAQAMLEGHPHLGDWNPHATIEVHETMQLPGM